MTATLAMPTDEDAEQNTFITQDKNQDNVVLLEDDGDDDEIGIGIDMISQSTLLQRKREEMKRVDLELLKTKQETEKIIERVEIGENEFRSKQEEFRKQIENFQKFIIDSDKKKANKLRQIEEEKKVIAAKNEIIDALKRKLSELNKTCKSLQTELVSLVKFQNYLNLVIQSPTNNYSMIEELLQRYTILMDTQCSLQSQNTELNAKIENIINEKNKYAKKQSNIILVKNSEIASCLKEYEKISAEAVHLEEQLFKQYSKNQQIQSAYNQVKLSIHNIYHRIYDSYTFKKPAYNKPSNSNYTLLLNEINQRLLDLIDINNEFGASAQ